MQNFDIILFAILAVFLALRLASVLGQRTGHEPRPGQWRGLGGRADESPQGRKSDAGKDDAPQAEDAHEEQEPLPEQQKELEVKLPALKRIRQMEPAFRVESFLKGARYAFTEIVAAFSNGALDHVRGLLASEVHGFLNEAIRERRKAGQRQTTELVSTDACNIVNVKLEGARAAITVRFRSTQVESLYDKDGKLLRGNPQKLTKAVDVWTFARALSSPNPNWRLVETRASAPQGS